ncbi:hypothetical protein, partial [Shewanella fodinae]
CGNFLARYGILWKPFRLFPATDTASRKCSSIRISYLGLFCRKDWQLGGMTVLVLTYFAGAFWGSLDVTWSTIALIDGMPLLLIQVFRYKAMTYFWQHGLQLA